MVIGSRFSSAPGQGEEHIVQAGALQADVVAKAALAILENELGWVNKLYREHEAEYSKNVNGYKVGDTIRIRRPVQPAQRVSRA